MSASLDCAVGKDKQEPRLDETEALTQADAVLFPIILI